MQTAVFMLIKIIVQYFECKIPERALPSLEQYQFVKSFQKFSHWFEAKMRGLSLFVIFTFGVFTVL